MFCMMLFINVDVSSFFYVKLLGIIFSFFVVIMFVVFWNLKICIKNEKFF